MAALLRVATNSAAPGRPAELSELRDAFEATAFRPVGLTTGSRLLSRLVDELEWASSAAIRSTPAEVADWPEWALAVRERAGKVLQESAAVLTALDQRSLSETRERLGTATAALADARETAARAVLTSVAAPADGQWARGALPRHAHELAVAAAAVGGTVQQVAAADSRPLVDRLLGRQVPGSPTGRVSLAATVAGGRVQRHSVWLQNSIRTGGALALAVLIAQVTDVQHGFWVVLGALSILRTSAVTIGSTALRALGGTLVGFALGAALMLPIGDNTPVLWVMLPVAVLLAGFVPEAISLAAGQAAFTVTVVILFNILDPVGWVVGVIRVEDVALGCLAGLVVGVLAWPRGAVAEIHRAIGDAYTASGHYFVIAVDEALRTDGGTASKGQLERAAALAKASDWRLDDALRQYLSERGGKSSTVERVLHAVSGVGRVRLTAQAIADETRAHPAVATSPEVQAELDPARRAVADRAGTVEVWLQHTATVLAVPGPKQLTACPPGEAESRVLEVLTGPDGLLDAAGTDAVRTVLWTALYVDDVDHLATRLAVALSTPAPVP